MKIVKLAAAPGFVLLAGCVTYPYQTAFDSCDAEAGACYRYCEDVADSDYQLGACHNECDNDANRCFASAYDRYSYGGSAYSGSYYQPSWPWRGRYGAWGPTNGYYFDFNYYGSSGYERPRRSRGYRQGSPNQGGSGQGGYRDQHRDGRSGAPHDGRNNDTPPPRRGSPPPAQQPSSPPVQQSSPPPAVPQTSPPPARTSPPNRPAKPLKERSGSGNTQPEDY